MQQKEIFYEYMGEGVRTMDDRQIVELFFLREERALEQTEKKYGAYCHSVALRIVGNREDAQECVNDTYLAAWNSIPPQKPVLLSAFLAKLTRRISVDRVRKATAKKRGGGELDLVFSELEECIPDEKTPERELIEAERAEIINSFLASLGDTERRVFLRRYFFADPIRNIAERFGFSETRIRSMLFRTREKLKRHLIKEGYYEIR